MTIREFRLLPQRDLVEIRAWLTSQIREWLGEWLSGEGEMDVAVNPDPLSTGDWDQAVVTFDNAERWCALLVESAAARRIAARLFANCTPAIHGEMDPGTLINDVLRESLAGLAGRLLTCAPPALVGGSVPDSAFAPGSGCAAFDIGVGDADFRCLLSAQTVADFLGDDVRTEAPRAEFLSIAEAIGGQIVRGECVLGETTLSLEALASIDIGDVIAIDRRVDEPLEIRFEGGAAVCTGYLCERSGRDALMLTKQRATDRGR